jgi:dipeptidyl aminopeptidase/acylaminoacyl peptidase
VSPKNSKKSANQKRRISAEDLYDFNSLSGVRLSPDGRHVIYAQNRVDRNTEKKYANLWMASVAGSGPRQFTFGDQSDSSPRWSPDGKWIAFLSNRSDPDRPASLFLIPFDGGEARQLTNIDGNIASFAWSPNGAQIVCAIRKLDRDQIERFQDKQKKELGVVARHYDRLFYKLDGVGYLPRERTHLWVITVESGKATQITDHAIFDELDPAWTPNGKSVIYLSNHSQDPDQERELDELFIIPTKGGESNKIPTPVGPKNKPAVSPDNKWVAYYGRPGKGESYRNTHLWLVPLDGSEEAQDLLAGVDLHADAGTINDLGAPEQIAPTWSPDSSRLYFQVVEHGKTMLKVVSIQDGKMESVIEDKGVVADFSFDQDHQRLAYLFGSMTDPGQIYVRSLPDGQPEQITRVNRKLLDQLDLGEVEEVWFKGPAGNYLQGWILKPPGFDPQKKYPSILEIHGGPLTQYGELFMHEFYYLAAQDYVVYFCNPRGGRGYGEAHAGAIWGGWGGADYDDLMAWADLVQNKRYISNKRMGVTGGSYGGYMTVWIIGHTDRFKAAVTQRCVSNLVSMWGSSDLNWVFQEILGDDAPYENLEKFWQHSPIAYIGNAVTPTLVIHSENDLRCPIEQGEQVFVALKRQGIPTEFVRFPGEFHGLSRTGRTDRRIVRLNHIARWFDQYLKS